MKASSKRPDVHDVLTSLSRKRLIILTLLRIPIRKGMLSNGPTILRKRMAMRFLVAVLKGMDKATKQARTQKLILLGIRSSEEHGVYR